MAPDVMVVLGVDGSHRRTYRIWDEGGRAPDFVLEVISSTTQENDDGKKRKTYAELGVREYFRYAPVSRRMAGMGGHRLVGEVLRDGRWEALPRLGRERIRSAVLGLDLRERERGTGGGFHELRFFDPIAGEDLRTLDESERARRESERARAEEREGRVRAEREIARLRAMLEQLPGTELGMRPATARELAQARKDSVGGSAQAVGCCALGIRFVKHLCRLESDVHRLAGCTTSF